MALRASSAATSRSPESVLEWPRARAILARLRMRVASLRGTIVVSFWFLTASVVPGPDFTECRDLCG